MRQIVWLASYPKSGNTWLRLLLANLGRDQAVSINALQNEGGTASGRRRFDETFLFASGLLSHDECDRMRPALYRDLARRPDPAGEGDGLADPGLAGLRFIKTHDAWTLTDRGEPLLGGAEAARSAILIVRDPRDLAASLANHNHQSLDEAIAAMASTAGVVAGAQDRQALQLRQQLRGWSGFCASWLDQREVPVHLLRYEDLLADTARELGRVLAALGVDLDRAKLVQAAALSGFAGLRAEEDRSGFREAPVRLGSGRFFRSGRAGGWREELSAAQCARIEADHGAMMRRCGYTPEAS